MCRGVPVGARHLPGKGTLLCCGCAWSPGCMTAELQLGWPYRGLISKLNGLPLLCCHCCHCCCCYCCCWCHTACVCCVTRDSSCAGKSLPSAGAKSSFSYGKLSNPAIINNGHTLQVALPPDFKSEVLIPIRGKHVQALSIGTFGCSCQAWMQVCCCHCGCGYA
jgi:hypothetical protein